MIVRFDYDYDTEFCLRTNSTLVIKGEGSWDVDETDLAEEWDPEEHNANDFIINYFWIELDVDPDHIYFNKEDLNNLIEYLNKYYNINGNKNN